MHVLVCVASKHGATDEIGSTIAYRLRSAGLDVEAIPAERKPNVAEFEAVVIGSAGYMGSWMSQARDLIEYNLDALRERPVWLFSSGPIGDKRDAADGAEGERLLSLVHGREHRVFPGSMDKDELGLTERLAIRMVKAPYGDYRPWSEIEDWADAIAKELTAVAVS